MKSVDGGTVLMIKLRKQIILKNMRQVTSWLKINIWPFFINLLNMAKILTLFILFYASLLFIVVNLNEELSDQILEYLKIISWPSVVIIICFQFNNEIKNLISKIISVELPGNLKVKTKTPDQNIDTVELAEETRNTKITTNNVISVANSEGEKNKNSSSQIKNLQNALYYEKVYNIIYGSQIELLEKLRSNSNGMIYQDIAAYYQQKRTVYPGLNSYSLENYLNFLKASNLVELFIEGNKHLYKITATGINFIDYIETNNYLKLKSF